MGTYDDFVAFRGQQAVTNGLDDHPNSTQAGMTVKDVGLQAAKAFKPEDIAALDVEETRRRALEVRERSWQMMKRLEKFVCPEAP